MGQTENMELFKKTMETRLRQTRFVDIKTEKDREYLKKELLADIKNLFESLDENDKESICNDAADIAVWAFCIANGIGKLSTFGKKIIEYTGINKTTSS